MKYKPVVLTLVICIVIAAAGLVYEYMIVKQDNGAAESRAVTDMDVLEQDEKMKELLQSHNEIIIDCLGDSITWGMFSTPALRDDIDSGEIETGPDDGGQLFEDAGIYISGVFQSDPTYPELLENELNSRLALAGYPNTVKTVNDGICGDWIVRNTYQRMSCDPDIVILLMGGNNFYFNYPIEGMFETNIKAIRERGAILYLANYPLYPGEKHVEAFGDANAHIAEISQKEGVPLIDLQTQMEEKVRSGEYGIHDLFSPDHIHLSETGYELIGQMITEAIFTDLTKE